MNHTPDYDNVFPLFLMTEVKLYKTAKMNPNKAFLKGKVCFYQEYECVAEMNLNVELTPHDSSLVTNKEIEKRVFLKGAT